MPLSIFTRPPQTTYAWRATFSEKRVRRLVRLVGHELVYPQPRLNVSGQGVAPYPYLLRERPATAPNEAWSADITYVLMAKGFLYLAAGLDWHPRYVLSWQPSNTLDVGFCLLTLVDALRVAPVPYIFNSDQGSQLVSRPCWTLAAASAAMAGAAPPTIPSLSAFGARSNGSTSTSIPPTMATICTTNYRRTLPTTITTGLIKA